MVSQLHCLIRVVHTAVFSLSCLQFVHWRRPRGTLSSRQTTLLTAACTQTVKGAQCPPSTAGPTPALNQSQTSRPAERRCAWSPSRFGSPRFFKQTLFTNQLRLFLPVRTQSCLLMLFQETRWRWCERGAIMYKRFYLPFFSWQASCHYLCDPTTTFKPPQSEAALQFWRTWCFSDFIVTIHNQMWGWQGMRL